MINYNLIYEKLTISTDFTHNRKHTSSWDFHTLFVKYNCLLNKQRNKDFFI